MSFLFGLLIFLGGVLALSGILWGCYVILLIVASMPRPTKEPVAFRRKLILGILAGLVVVCLGWTLWELYEALANNHPRIKTGAMILAGVGFVIQFVSFLLARDEFDLADLWLSPIRALLGVPQYRALEKLLRKS